MGDPFVFEAGTCIQRALELDERVVEALKGLGLKCVDHRDEMCPAAAVETLADAARFHEIPLERILETLQALGLPARAPAP
jgi:pyrrolidone-carboxylate peptidase